MFHVKPMIDDSFEAFLRAEGVTTSYAEGVDVALLEDERIIGAAHLSFLPDTALLGERSSLRALSTLVPLVKKERRGLSYPNS